jgi:hypothetical protein
MDFRFAALRWRLGTARDSRDPLLGETWIGTVDLEQKLALLQAIFFVLLSHIQTFPAWTTFLRCVRADDQ